MWSALEPLLAACFSDLLVTNELTSLMEIQKEGQEKKKDQKKKNYKR